MFKQQQQYYMDLKDNVSFGDSKSWLSEGEVGGEDETSPPLSNGIGSNSNNVDGVLLKNLVEIVPLVESLMDQRTKTSFTSRASVIYTKTPSKDSDSKKITDPKGRKKAAQSIPPKKHRDCLCEDKKKSKNAQNNELSTFKSKASAMQKDREELITLQERVENLQKRLLEKDELLKSAQISMNQMAALSTDVEEMKNQVLEKDSLIESTHLKLSDAKIKLADKQATLERLQLEAMTSNRKIETLQEDLDSMQWELSTFMLLLEILNENSSTSQIAVYDTTPYDLDHLPYLDTIDDTEMQQMEEVRKAYIEAVTTAKENQDEESVVLAAKVRLHLQSFVLGPKSANPEDRIHGWRTCPLDMVS
ncbi:hypothetical protein BVC80_9049g33 [Macleaya cordata]|uniref:Movement protein binding protein 2C n=1 Tax=Macleaya cordata TaxID=56857 RepID=A0A200R2F2_MACCD|nr:hypothetical protein BVC80_9049g33 [Macleaya cordata]